MNPSTNRNQQIINWYEKEIKKDKKEIDSSKEEIAAALKNIDKVKLFEKAEKPKLSLWKKILKAITGH